ncbi:MAG: RluA family pseudouridine synthase [Candidatus Eremiobacteraeota bacterium]|nr:RluA family pseudouridine synthase [Candidatus Eremiobacteraeota bacterium]
MSRYVATAEDEGHRTDAVIAKVSAQPRSRVTAAHREGRVLVNGTLAKPSTPLHAGDVVEYAVELPAPLVVEAEELPLEIVHEDDDIIVVNKPAGMVTHPAHGAVDGTLVNALLAHLPGLPGERTRAGLVHRLDRDTSGLLAIAKTPEALATLGRAMKARYIEREYLALVTGIPADREGTIEGPLGRDPANRLKYAIRAEGKPAVTHFRVRERLRNAAELLLRLETGRTHQIRVHLAAIGHPLVNDPLYGRSEARFSLPGQALHAWRLKLKHPRTKERLSFEVPPPAEYVAAKVLLTP